MGARGREGEKACVCVRACTCRRDGVKNKQGKGSDKHSPNLIQASGDSKNQNERNDVAHHKPAGGGVPGVRGTGQQVQPMPDQCAQQGAGRRKSRRSRPRETMLRLLRKMRACMLALENSRRAHKRDSGNCCAPTGKLSCVGACSQSVMSTSRLYRSRTPLFRDVLVCGAHPVRPVRPSPAGR